MTPLLLLICALRCLAALPTGEWEPGALVAYSCEDPRVNITKVDLTRVGACKEPQVLSVSKNSTIQVLLKPDFQYLHVTSCFLTLTRTLEHCGMFSHVSPLSTTQRIKKLSRTECHRVHSTGEFTLYGQTFRDIAPNNTTPLAFIAAGQRDMHTGYCENQAVFHDYDGPHQKVVASYHGSLTLTDYTGIFDESTGHINLRSGLTADYSKGEITDLGSSIYWDILPTPDSCDPRRSKIVYAGPALLVTSRDPDSDHRDLYAIVDRDTTFAVRLLEKFTVCGQRVYRTEHPGITVLDTTYDQQLQHYRAATVAPNLRADIIGFFISKLMYVQYYAQHNLQRLHVHSLKARCALERQILFNKLALMRSNPSNVAHVLFDDPQGKIATLSGETATLISCIAIPVTFRDATPRCYDALPITVNNQSMFMSPISHIIVPSAAQITCSKLNPQNYRILSDVWVSLSPDVNVLPSPPIVLQPSVDDSLHFGTLKRVSGNGLYSLNDLRQLHKSMVFPGQRSAITTHITNQLLGFQSHSEFSALNLFSKQDLDSLAQSTMSRLWQYLSTLGIISSSFIGIAFIFQGIKYILSTLCRCFHLKNDFGWSPWLLAGLWEALSNIILHRRTRKYATRQPESAPAQPLQLACPALTFEFPGKTPPPPSHPPPPPPPAPDCSVITKQPSTSTPQPFIQTKGQSHHRPVYPVLPTPRTPSPASQPAVHAAPAAPVASAPAPEPSSYQPPLLLPRPSSPYVDPHSLF